MFIEYVRSNQKREGEQCSFGTLLTFSFLVLTCAYKYFAPDGAMKLANF
jgi:hypothetical protein